MGDLKPLVILHLTAPARIGGLERVVAALSTGHARMGHEVHVAAVVESADAADQFLAPLAARGVHVHPLVLPGRAYRRERAAVRALCRTLAPGVVHTHGYRADVVSLGIARRLGIATATTVHGFTGGSWRNRLYEWLQVLAFRRLDAVVAVSRPLATLLRARGVPDGQLELIGNAWSPHDVLSRAESRTLLGLPADAFCVGWLGRLTREKGADVLLEAVPQLGRDVVVSFIGDGRERRVLEDRAAVLGVSQQVRWHGMVGDAGRTLAAFDAFVLSSRTEGTPIALFEAMAAGVPIVATRVGGIPDVIAPCEALIVPSEDPAAVAAALCSVREDASAARARAERAAQRLAREFAVDPWLAAYETLYRQLLDA